MGRAALPGANCEAQIGGKGAQPHGAALLTYRAAAEIPVPATNAAQEQLSTTKELLLRSTKPEEWHLHRFRDTAATRWLRAGIDVRTVQAWLGHESLATTQKYLEPSHDTEKALSKMRLPF